MLFRLKKNLNWTLSSEHCMIDSCCFMFLLLVFIQTLHSSSSSLLMSRIALSVLISHIEGLVAHKYLLALSLCVVSLKYIFQFLSRQHQQAKAKQILIILIKQSLLLLLCRYEPLTNLVLLLFFSSTTILLILLRTCYCDFFSPFCRGSR